MLAVFSLLHLVQPLYQQYCKVAWKVVLSVHLSSCSLNTWPKDHDVFRCKGFHSTAMTSPALPLLEPAAFNDTQYQCWRTERTIISVQHLRASCDLTSVHHFPLFICYLDWKLLFTVILYMKLTHNLNIFFHFSQCLQYCHIILKWETKITVSVQVWMVSDVVWIYTVLLHNNP